MAPIERVVDDGMAVIHEGNQPVVDIVFVHGLQGHPQRSWTAYPRSHSPSSKKKPRNKFKSCFPSRSRSNSPSVKRGRSPVNEGVFWPRDLLPKQFKEDNVRILTWGYNSTVLEFFAGSNQNGITHHAKNLLGDLVTVRADVGNRKMILVAHSLGGIIIKEMLRRSQELQHIASSHEIQAATYAAMFFGTPHRGSPAAQWGLMASRLATLSGASTNRKIVTNLQSDSEILEVGRMSFANFIKYDQIKVHSFLEERGVTGIVGLSGKIVEDVSAVIGDACEGVEGINANHDQMCKFASAESIGFIKAAHVLKKWTKEIAQAAQLSQIEESKPIPLTAEEVKLVQGFYTSDYLTHREGLAMRHEGTCQWIFQHRGYLDWYKASEQTVLWVSGNPGMGKTILASAVIETLELQTSDAQKVIYFFCDDKYDNQRSFTAILRGLVHQLLLTDTKNRVEKYVKPHEDKKNLHNSLAAIWDIFVSIIEEKEGTTICILDALDECDETSRGHFFMFIQEFFSKPASKAGKGKLKLLFTSRPYDSIRWEFLGLPEKMQLRIKAEAEEELINRDIMAYIDSEVERLAKLRCYDAALKNLVHTSLKTRADGSFLWASLVLRILLKTPTSKVEQRLKAFPAELESVYSRIMTEMSRDARSMLVWITHAVRPMTLPDLAAALAIEHGDSEDAAYLVDAVTVQRLKADLELCYPLVKIHTDGETETVHLVHQTAKEFLQDKCQEWGLDRPTSHNEIAMSCLTYLCSAHMRKGPIPHLSPGGKETEPSGPAPRGIGKQPPSVDLLRIVRKWPFIMYAATNWMKHVALAEETYAEWMWKHLYRSLTAGKKTELSLQLYANREGSNIFDLQIEETSVCSILAFFGLSESLRAIHKHVPGLSLDTQGDYGVRPLSIAVMQNNFSIVRFLTEEGGVILKTGQQEDAETITQAASRGNAEIFRYLLENAQLPVSKLPEFLALALEKVCSQGHVELAKCVVEYAERKKTPITDRLWRPVVTSIKGGRLEALEFLVKLGNLDLSELHLHGIRGNVFTPVGTAVMGIDYKGTGTSYLELLKFLIQDGRADLNAKSYPSKDGDLKDGPLVDTRDGCAPLSLAAMKGDLEMAKLLLQSENVDLESKDEQGRTPLSWAAGRGHVDIVKLLVSTGKVELDVLDATGRAPVSWASAGGHLEAVELLVSTGIVDLDRPDRTGRTPLFWAAGARLIPSQSVVEYLLKTGKVNGNSRDLKFGRTPLIWAVRQENFEAVKALVESGKVDVNARDNKGRTPFISINATSVFGRSWGMLDTQNVVRYLNEVAKVDVDAQDDRGRTFFSHAIECFELETVDYLLQSGKVDVDRKDNHGRPPMYYAYKLQRKNFRNGHCMVYVLRKAGAQKLDKKLLHDVLCKVKGCTLSTHGRDSTLDVQNEHQSKLPSPPPANTITA